MPAKVSAFAALCTKGMFWALLTTLLWIPSVVTGAAFRPRGTAPYSNTTSITTSNALAPSTVSGSFSTTQPPYPIHASGTGVSSELVHSGPTGGSPRPIKPSGSINSTNVTSTGSSCTVNIPNANLEWWYAATYDYYLGTFTATAPNWTNEDNIHLTMIPNSEPFDLSSTISNDVAYTETPVYDPIFDEYFTQYAEYLVIPTAAATSVITRNAASPLPSGNVILAPERTLYMNTNPLAPASVTIASTANSTSAITSATPFVYFTAYEVESVANGSTMTETISLRQPAAFEYPVKGIESSVSASGTLPDEVLQRLPQSTCSPGTVQGPVTVLIVLDLFWFYFPKPVPFIVHFESSVLGFESEPVVVAQDTSKGQPFTINLDPKPTQPGGAKTTAERKPGILQTAPGPVSTAPSGEHNGGSKIPNVPQPTQQTVGTIGTNPVVVGPSSQVIVGTETLKPGGPAVTIGGSSISLAPSATAIVVGGQTSSLPLVADPASPTQTVGTIGGMPVVVLPSSVVVVGTQTLQPGGAVTIGGNPVSLAPSATAIIIGGKTSTLPQVIFPGEAAPTQAPAPPVLTIGSSTLTANAATQFFIGPGQTLTPGGTATVGGTVVSLGPSASFVVIGGTTSVLPGTEPTAEPAIMVGSSTITALPGPPNALNQDTPTNGESGPTFVVSGQTLVPGHEITVDGTTISLAPSGSFVVINGVTSTLATAPAAQITPPPLTIGNGVFSALPGTGTTYVIDSATLTPGGVITVDGTTISLAPGATALVVNGVTTTLNPEAQATITNPPLLTIGSHTYTAAPGAGTTFIIDGQTLTPGGTITVDGTTISLAPGATELIYGGGGHSTTSALFPATTTRSQSITGLASAFASAGATGQNGEAVATSSATGAGKSIVAPKTKGCILPLVAGLLGMLLR